VREVYFEACRSGKSALPIRRARRGKDTARAKRNPDHVSASLDASGGPEIVRMRA